MTCCHFISVYGNEVNLLRVHSTTPPNRKPLICKLHRTLAHRKHLCLWDNFLFSAWLKSHLKPDGEEGLIVLMQPSTIHVQCMNIWTIWMVSRTIPWTYLCHSARLTNFKSMFVFCVFSGCYRDESASATYYFGKKTASAQVNDTASTTCPSGPDSLVAEWMYYRPLQQGEDEFSLRSRQVGCATWTL